MKTILVIEDEPSVRSNIVELLEAEDFQAIGAENGILGVMGAIEYAPDLIICDVMMPELDGYGVLATLRQDPVTATIPFIFLTAKADRSDLREGMDLGADDYLTKPFTSEELLKSITARLERQAAFTQQYVAKPKEVELQQKIQKFQQNTAQDESLKKVYAELSFFLSKINLALYVLKQTPPGIKRDRAVEILQEACNREVEILNQIPTLQDFLSTENISLLHQLNLVNHQSD